jgi:hypothetical protein
VPLLANGVRTPAMSATRRPGRESCMLIRSGDEMIISVVSGER